MTAVTQQRDGIETPSTAERLVTGMSAIGGPAVAREALRGGEASIRDDIVHLAPGLSDSVELFLGLGSRSYTVVEPDPVGAAALRARGARVVEAPVAATGLPDAEASLVALEGVLCGLSDEGVADVLAEAERLLAPRGRLVVRDVAGRGIATPSGRPARDAEVLREAIDAAGLEPRGVFSAPLGVAGDPWPEVVRSGPKVGLKLGPAVAKELSPMGAAERLRRLRTGGGDGLRAVVIIAEKPVLMGLRWPASE